MTLQDLRESKYIARFLSKIEISESGCWDWTAGVFSAGYALLSMGDRPNHPTYAHRFAYRVFIGEIPEGLQLDHLCRNRKCVNPDHLEAVTGRENVLRGTGPTAQLARKTHCPKGHPYTDSNTYIHPPRSRNCRICRREQSAIYRARKREMLRKIC